MDESKRSADPLGGPQPIEAGSFEDVASRVTRALGRVVVVGGAVFTFLGLVAAMCTPTMGSTRSARLKWRERQRQVDAAVQAAEGPREAR